MKYILLTGFISLLCFFNHGQKQNRELRAYLDNKQFYAPTLGNYVEFHLKFFGYSINYKGQDDGLIGEVAVQMSITQSNEVIASDAYRLSTPFMKDSIIEDFYDIKRFMLEPGAYTFNLELQDLNSTNAPLSTSQTITVQDLSNAISFSDIEVAELATKGDENSVFFKSGYNIIPRLSTFYPEELNTIPVYFEIYNSRMLEDTIFGIKQSLYNATNELEIIEYTKYSKHYAAEVVPILKKVDISNLTTGKYILNYTIVNKNMKELSTQSYIFDRSYDKKLDFYSDEIVIDPAFQKSITDDSVEYYLESLIPISGSSEVKNIIKIAKTKDNVVARKYIQLYWAKTAPHSTYDEWIKYKQQVVAVERLYANNFQEGFETDRGRVYLQYGSPAEIITQAFSSSEYPHEIWRYNKIGKFSNKRFVFYNPDLVNKAYRLLHSDMIGELKNPAWQSDLVRRNTMKGNIDNPNSNIQDSYGKGALDDY